MSVQLDTIVLPDLILKDLYGNPKISADVEMSIGGVPIINEQDFVGRPLTLIGGDVSEWIAFSDLQNLITLASTKGASYTLTYESTIFTVRFRHEDSPVIEAEALIPRSNHVATDWFKNVVIKLMEV